MEIERVSISDVITNSSSECFVIFDPKITTGEFRERWQKQLEEWGETKDEYYEQLKDTFDGEIYMKDGKLYLDYPYMCNVDHNIEEKLEEWFGSENVESKGRWG